MVHDIVIVGSGFAGLGMAIRLKQEGRNDFVVLEKASDVGGTWRDNTYPGCACDVQSHLYSFSFEPNPSWSRMFAPQPEILAYLRHCSEKHGVTPHIRFNTALKSARWDGWKWRVTTENGQTLHARVLVSGMGGLSTPSWPGDIPGLARFQGKTFHSQQWDHTYSLDGKRVAVIGTGASAIQFVPKIQKQVGRLDLYQRTPPWILPKRDRPVSPTEKALFKTLPVTQKMFRGALYAMLESRVFGFTINPKLMGMAQKLAKKHLAQQVPDENLRRKLTPDYTMGCKRVLISNDYYPSLTQPNVDVITTGIREVREHSIVTTDGVEREVDAIIFGTGFKATDPVPAKMIFGVDGKDITDAWKDGPEAYKGTAVAGFPNLFLIVGPNTGLGHSSMVYMIESQVHYVLDALRTMEREGIVSVDVKEDAQAGFNAAIQARLKDAIWKTGGCKSWYVHPSGKNVTLWPGFTFQFRQTLSTFDVAAYRVERAPQQDHTHEPAIAA